MRGGPPRTHAKRLKDRECGKRFCRATRIQPEGRPPPRTKEKDMSGQNTDKTPIRRVGEPRASSPFTAPREACWNVILDEVGAKLAKRGFAVSIASSLKDAAALVMNELLPESGAESVAFGGSMTVREAGLLEALQARNGLAVLNTFDTSKGQEAMLETRRQALLCDLFICSANALTRDGELLLVDGFGNRTAAVQFGPRKVILLVGRNKLCASRESAVERIKNLAAPANGMRLKKDTPCAKVGYCMDCNNPGRMCTYWTLIQRSNPKGRIHVALIDEECGF